MSDLLDLVGDLVDAGLDAMNDYKNGINRNPNNNNDDDEESEGDKIASEYSPELIEDLNRKCKILKPIVVVLILLGILVYYLIVLYLPVKTETGLEFKMLSFPLCLAPGLIASMFLGRYSSKKKKFVIYEVASEIYGDNFSYEPSAHIPNEMLNLMEALHYTKNYDGRSDRSGRHIQTTSLIRAEYKDVYFEAADIHVYKQTTDADGNTHTNTYFKNRVTIYEFSKPVMHPFAIVEKGSDIPLDALGFNKENLVKSELTKFNKQYKVYATDKAEIFSFLTPKILDSLLQLEKTIKGNLTYIFYGNFLYTIFTENGLANTSTKRQIAAIFKSNNFVIDDLDLDGKYFVGRKDYYDRKQKQNMEQYLEEKTPMNSDNFKWGSDDSKEDMTNDSDLKDFSDEDTVEDESNDVDTGFRWGTPK